MPIENCDYFIHLVDFPTCASGGCVVLNDNGTYTILLNAHCSRRQNEDSMIHELRHILRGDLYSSLPVSELEREDRR